MVTSLNNVGINQQYGASKRNNLYQVNFRADENDRYPSSQPRPQYAVRPQQPARTAPPANYNQQAMLMRKLQEAEEAQKKEKRKSNIAWAVSVAAGLAIVASFLFKGNGNGASEKAQTEARKVITKDVSGERGFEKMYLSKELEDIVQDLKIMIEREEGLRELGAKTNSGILLYGAPGGGKNAFTYAFTKEIQKTYPGSELIFVDVNKFKGSYVGDTENNILSWVDNILKLAKSNPEKKYIVYMDEFDSIASKATGSGADTKEGFQNAFKTTLQSLLDTENIQVIAATNKASKDAPLDQFLESAIVDRFARPIHVPMPSKEQLVHSFVEHFKDIPAHRTTKEILDINNPKLNKICQFMNENDASFREFNAIIDEAKKICEGPTRKTKQPLTIQDLIDATIKVADRKHWDSAKINAFKKAVSA